MTDVIELRELRVSAVVGVLAEERNRPQPLVFNLDIERPFEAAAISDDLSETTNYAEVLAMTERVAREGSFLLLETLAYRLAHEILALDGAIEAVSVAVRKERPPVSEDVASVGVRCSLRR
ncbi:MAG TPA: dihydroneopterin aldolase [Acidimicrobiales bacterium]|nr:dihydroneopterin aldolase [Acidimicrobiales bacterium]